METSLEHVKNQPRLAEIPELQATGRVAEIYDEIRRLSGVPVVALIYRHMATLPGVLEWVWRWQRPLMESGLLQKKARAVLNHEHLPSVPPLPLLARQATGITEADERLIATVLATFNRCNPINLVALCCLQRYFYGKVESSGHVDVSEWTVPDPISSLPPICQIDDMDSTTREIIGWLSHRGHGRYAGIWPSLYRYLAHVPQYLGLAAIILSPHFDEIDNAVVKVQSDIAKAADELVTQVPPPGSLALDDPPKKALEQAINNFTSLIPEAMVVGALLERATVRELSPS